MCKAYEQSAGQENSIECQEWYETHEPDCNANHEGSAESMKVNFFDSFGKKYFKSDLFDSILENVFNRSS